MKRPRFPVVRPNILLIIASILAMRCAMIESETGDSDETVWVNATDGSYEIDLSSDR
ncbi:MAG: hypothetical protein R6W94_14975 [Spirochaetia bacterium]